MVGRGQRGRGRRGGRGGRCGGRVVSSTTTHSDSPPLPEPQADATPSVDRPVDSPPLLEPQADATPSVDRPVESPPLEEPQVDATASVGPQVDQSASMEPQVDNVNTQKTSSKRGITCGHGARNAMRSAKDRLTIEFDFTLMQAICNNAEFFNNEIGYIVHKHCSLRYKDWRLVPSEVRGPLRSKLETLFNVNIEDENVRKCIDKQMQRAWRGHKYKLHAHFKEIGGEEHAAMAKSMCPEDVSQEDWAYPCDLWSNGTYKERSKKNAEARDKRKWESRNGSKSTARHHVSRGADLDAPTSQIETWRMRHWHSERGWISSQAAATYEEMMQLRRDNSLEQMTDKEILERVIGRHSVRLFGWGWSPSTSRTTGSSGDLGRPTYTQLLNTLSQCESRVAELEGTVQNMQQVLTAKNIIPPPPVPHVPSDHGSGPSHPVTRDIDPASHHSTHSRSHNGSDDFADANSNYDDIA